MIKALYKFIDGEEEYAFKMPKRQKILLYLQASWGFKCCAKDKKYLKMLEMGKEQLESDFDIKNILYQLYDKKPGKGGFVKSLKLESEEEVIDKKVEQAFVPKEEDKVEDIRAKFNKVGQVKFVQEDSLE